MRRALAGAILALAFGQPSAAQDWSFIAPLTAQVLDVRPGDGAPMLFSDHPDPAMARYSVIFHYFPSRGGGNSMSLNVGLFEHTAEGWQFARLLDVFGSDPREGQFSTDLFEVTTTTLGPGEPRCCPTQTTRWVVDLRSGETYRR